MQCRRTRASRTRAERQKSINVAAEARKQIGEHNDGAVRSYKSNEIHVVTRSRHCNMHEQAARKLMTVTVYNCFKRSSCCSPKKTCRKICSAEPESQCNHLSNILSNVLIQVLVKPPMIASQGSSGVVLGHQTDSRLARHLPRAAARTRCSRRANTMIC